MDALTTGTFVTAEPAKPICQTCQQPIYPDEAVNVCPAPNDSVWHMHARVVQCLSRLTGATIEQTARALVRE